MQLLAAAKAVSLTCSALMATSGLVLTLTCPIPASAWTHGSTVTPPGTCLRGTSYVNPYGVNDGCAAAPAGGTISIPLSSFNQDGQTTLLTTYTRAWNLAGVSDDGYAVGPYTALVDPSTNPPTPCSYASNSMSCGNGSNQAIDHLGR